jgi:Ala-tRNA(Pro) deacylase
VCGDAGGDDRGVYGRKGLPEPSNWLPLEELELMEQRMRRLLTRPAGSTTPASKASKRPLGAKRGGSMFTTHQPADALMDALRREHVSYELFPHRRTETALGEAEALHVDPHQVAKTLVLRTPFGYVRVALRAVDRLNLEKARIVLGTNEVELATEEDLVGAYPEFELGAVPPVGGAYDRVLVDERLFDSTTVLFDAGTHDESIRLRVGDLLALADAEVADLAQENREPEEMS